MLFDILCKKCYNTKVRQKVEALANHKNNLEKQGKILCFFS